MITKTRFDFVRAALRVSSITVLAAILGGGAWVGQARAANCLATAAGDTGLTCNANDFAVTSIIVDNLIDGCSDYGDTFTFDGRFGIASGSPNRYDIGIFVSGDGVQAYTGTQCTVSTIPNQDPFPNLDGDQCRDYNGSAQLVPIANVTTTCVDADRNGFYDVTICTSWDNNAMPNCAGVDDLQPATRSKCSCRTVNTTVVAPRCSTNSDCPSDGNVCTTATCNPPGSPLGDQYGCSQTNNTATCDDGLFCTENDKCGGGTCSGTARNCSDGNVCTTDTCNESTDQCVHTNNSVSCNDGQFCTVNDVCSGGVCSGPPRNCSDGNVCTSDSCNETTDQCVHTPNTLPCDDGLFCNGTDTCSGGTCQHTGNPCPGPDGDGNCTESCNEAADDCSANDPNGSGCNDGLFCTTGDTCQAGVCRGSATDCDDGNVCTDDGCDEAADSCTNTPNTDPCNDGLYCTDNDTCSGGTCAGSPRDCSDGDVCTDDDCDEDADECVHEFNTSPCDDGLFCTTGDTCNEGTCEAGAPRTCDDSNVCTDDSCDEEGDKCDNEPNTDPCDDDLFCNGEDICADGVCGHSGNPCDGADGDANCAETCDEEADNCEGNDPNNSPCDDGLFCTVGDKCTNGLCTATPRNCDDDNVCTGDSCDEGADTCVNAALPNGTACEDGQLCTIEDICQNGQCVGLESALFDLCPWIIVQRAGAKRDTLKIRSRDFIGNDLMDPYLGGDVCGGTIKVGNQTTIRGDIVSGLAFGSKAMRLSPDTFIEEDIVTDGAGARAKPGVAKLPHLAAPTSRLSGGTVTPKTAPAGFYHLDGTHPLSDICVSARTVAYENAVAILDGLSPSQVFQKVRLKRFQSLTVLATNPGGIEMVDIGLLKTGRNATITLDGGGNALTAMVLRVTKKFALGIQNSVVLAGGLTPENVLYYVKGRKCSIGNLGTGSGTLFCASGRMKTGRGVIWTGTFYGAGNVSKIGDTNDLTYAPFLGF